MAELKLTAAQQAVVDDRGGTLLVSAAAGSGKTKVLVDRLLSMVLNPDAPRNVDDFLLITYTKAAAAELRGKILAAMQERLAQEPANRYLQRQLTRIYLADISTVHAFCAGILREHAYLLDIPADFRVAEELETGTLRDRVMEQVVAAQYEAAEPEFMAFADTLGSGRDDRALAEIGLTLYDKAQSHRDPRDWMRRSAEMLDPAENGDFGATPWGAVLLDALRRTLSDCISAMNGALRAMEQAPALEAAYGPSFREDLQKMETLCACGTWDETISFGLPEFGRLKPVRNCEDLDCKELVQAVRKDCKEKLKGMFRSISLSSAEAAAETAESAPAIRGALRLAEEFGAQYQKEKRRRHILDFGDLEHEALRLLCRGDRPAPAAREIAARYAAIMVDEYQDSNEVQDAIFRAVSQNEENLFFVGDVKQSIYRFRLADPGIFLEKYKRYPLWTAAKPSEPRKIILSENFRSRKEILGAVNDVFANAMSERTGDLRYGEEEALKAGLEFPPREGACVELHCISEDFDAADEGPSPKKEEVEAAFVADRIAALLQSGASVTERGALRPVRPEDIAILLRSPRSSAPAYLAALSRAGIPCFSDAGEDILKTTELQVVSSLLEVVENPHQDIPLLAVLASPLCGFSASELAQIRGGSKTGDFYDALQASELPKAAAFLESLNRLRSVSEQDGLPTLLDAVLQETDAEAVFRAMQGGEARAANLRCFRALVLSHAAGGGDLVGLIKMLRDLRETGLTVTEAAGRGAVLLTSIHKSKGLEYPVVFLSGLSKGFNLDDLRKPVLIHPTLGVASNVTDLKLKVRYPSAAKLALARKMHDEAVSEELRVLYVAMTRAKDLLILTDCSDHYASRLGKRRRWLDLGGPEAVSAMAACEGDWVLTAALRRTEAGALHALCGAPQCCAVSQQPWDIELHSGTALLAAPRKTWQGTAAAKEIVLPDREALQKALSYEYPFRRAAEVPSKLTATQLKGRGLDEEISEFSAVPHRAFHPSFLETGMTAAEAGTALHLSMQFIRYEACTSEAGVRAELNRLRDEEFLTAAQAEAVDPAKIFRFFASPLGRRVLKTKNLRREFKFSVLVDAGEAAPGEQVMLQGVTDCCLLEPDHVAVIDFKTDRVAPGKEAERAEYYRGQLEGYAEALARIFERPVTEKLLYFFSTDTVAAL